MLALADALGESELLGDCELDALALGLTLLDALELGETDLLAELDGDTLLLTDALGETLALGETDLLVLELGLTDADPGLSKPAWSIICKSVRRGSEPPKLSLIGSMINRLASIPETMVPK